MTTRTPTHPGAILREDVLPALFAEQTGIDVETLQEILAERADVTPEIAEKLGKRLGNGADIWLALQEKYNVEFMRNELREHAAKARETAITHGVLEHPRVTAIKAEAADGLIFTREDIESGRVVVDYVLDEAGEARFQRARLADATAVIEDATPRSGVSVVLRPRCMTRPIAVARVLRAYGVRLRDAHLAINQLAAGNNMTVSIGEAYDVKQLLNDLKYLGVIVERADEQ